MKSDTLKAEALRENGLKVTLKPYCALRLQSLKTQ